ncbi:hypothetical protein G6F56_008504 [Rhizopus delemar]|nr:hypothetical protein G6F56_008504 [Rhizopus delemar]
MLDNSSGPGDVGLLIVVDGFQPKHKNKATMRTICGYIMAMEPTERYKDKNVITFAVIPSPKKPANLMSFLDPILSEIKDLDIFHGVTGDIPGIAELMNHREHNCLHGCRFAIQLSIPSWGMRIFQAQKTCEHEKILLMVEVIFIWMMFPQP